MHAYEITSARDALEALFRLEDAFELTPAKDGSLTIDLKAKGAQKLAAAIKAWQGVLDDLEAGKITQDEYELWRASFKA